MCIGSVLSVDGHRLKELLSLVNDLEGNDLCFDGILGGRGRLFVRGVFGRVAEHAHPAEPVHDFVLLGE